MPGLMFVALLKFELGCKPSRGQACDFCDSKSLQLVFNHLSEAKILTQDSSPVELSFLILHIFANATLLPAQASVKIAARRIRRDGYQDRSKGSPGNQWVWFSFPVRF